ncbi:MAG TPA: hypothetical protein ACFCUY_16020 [Xenococcaceae cyanobacterium]
MSNPYLQERSNNKKIIINNSHYLKQYALDCYNKMGNGIITINLTKIDNFILPKEDFIVQECDETRESISLQTSITYIPENNFWFKMISLKIKKKYCIDLKKDYDLTNQFLLVFIKDDSLESFSIYSLKIKNKF